MKMSDEFTNLTDGFAEAVANIGWRLEEPWDISPQEFQHILTSVLDIDKWAQAFMDAGMVASLDD